MSTVSPGKTWGAHPSNDQLNAYAANSLSQQERAKLAAHIHECAECREVLELIAPEEGPPAAPKTRKTAV